MSFKINDSIILDGDTLYINDTKVTTKVLLNGILIWSPKEGGGMVNIIAGNFKMNPTTVAQNRQYLDYWKEISPDPNKKMVIFPQTLLAQDTVEYLKGYNISVGLQIGSSEVVGAYTGQNSMTLAKSIGCEYVLIHQVEVEQYMGETLDEANAKVKQAISAGLTPLICCGDNLTERDAETWKYLLPYQVAKLVNGISHSANIGFVYEPLWAIGTGRTITPSEVNDACMRIRDTLSQLAYKVSEIPILFGGSVTANNADVISQEKDIDGALIAGSAMNANIIQIYNNWRA